MSGGSRAVAGGPAWLDVAAARPTTAHAKDDEFNDEVLDAAWIAVEPSDPLVTWTEGKSLLSCYHPGGDAQQEWHGLMKPLSGLSAPLTIETAVRMTSRIQSYPMAGLVFSNGVTHGAGSQMNATLMQYTGNNTTFTTRSWTNWTTFGTDHPSEMAIQQVGNWFHMRLRWVSANTWSSWVSVDGVSWIPWTVSSSFTMTPTHMGLCCSTYGGTYPTIFSFEYFRVT